MIDAGWYIAFMTLGIFVCATYGLTAPHKRCEKIFDAVLKKIYQIMFMTNYFLRWTLRRELEV